MSARRIRATELDFGSVRTEFALTEGYPADAVAEAGHIVDAFANDRADRTDLPLVTIDPPTSMDLDQAVHLERTTSGFVLHYAIADLGAVVVAGGALDREARRRGQTYYFPDESVPLHPRELSEGTGSLLPDQTRPAALWTIELDERAEPVRFSVSRAHVRSVARFDYAGVQADADNDRLHPSIAVLPEFGRLRIAAATARGAIELRLPEQDVVRDGSGWKLVAQPRTHADDWNAQVSLLTGMCAATMMIDARVGLLRTMRKPDPDAVASMRRTANALGIAWPVGTSVGALLAGLDPNEPATLVLMSEATGLLRGADYVAFDGALPELVTHSGIGAPYTHVTAPLRRLTDRFTTETCLALSAGVPVPQWVRQALPALVETMRASDTTANKIDRACVDLTEATVLSDRVGEEFTAVVLREADGKRDAEIYVDDPPVVARCSGGPPEGRRVDVRLVSADATKRLVAFAYSAGQG